MPNTVIYPSCFFLGTGIAQVTFLRPRGPVYRYELSNATHITAEEQGRHLRDPYEAQFIETKKSKVCTVLYV